MEAPLPTPTFNVNPWIVLSLDVKSRQPNCNLGTLHHHFSFLSPSIFSFWKKKHDYFFSCSSSSQLLSYILLRWMLLWPVDMFSSRLFKLYCEMLQLLNSTHHRRFLLMDRMQMTGKNAHITNVMHGCSSRESRRVFNWIPKHRKSRNMRVAGENRDAAKKSMTTTIYIHLSRKSPRSVCWPRCGSAPIVRVFIEFQILFG